jgi:hypothetical protein
MVLTGQAACLSSSPPTAPAPEPYLHLNLLRLHLHTYLRKYHKWRSKKMNPCRSNGKMLKLKKYM